MAGTGARERNLFTTRKRGSDAMLERWWQPTFFPTAVVEARSAVAQVGRTAPAAQRRPLPQFLFDRLAAMLQFDQRHNFGSWSSLPGQRDARGLAAWVDLQGERLEDGVWLQPVDQPDGKREPLVNAGAPRFKQLPGAFMGARHKGLRSFVENVDHFDLLPSRNLVLRKEPTQTPALGAGLPSGTL